MTSVIEPVDSYAIFVGSLSAATTQESLVQYFSRFGIVQGANLITDWATGASKRCAIVFCADEATCCRVLAYKTHKLDGKIIRVTMADQDKKGTKKISTTNLFVGNIAERCTEEEIRVLFDKFGQIESVRFFKNASTKPNTKNAIIQYFDSKSVELAFKSKSEMGTTDDSLKISPLKQKKCGNLRSDNNFEDLASMMVLQMCNQGLPLSGPHSQMWEAEDQFQTEDIDFPVPPVRKHRKSSSVDMLPPTRASHTEITGSTQGYGPSFGNRAPIMLPRLSKRAEVQYQAPERGSRPQANYAGPTIIEAQQETTTPGEFVSPYNFVTLIDLFDEDDGLSTSFYGESPLRKSRAGKSNCSSRYRFNASRSNSSDEAAPSLQSHD